MKNNIRRRLRERQEVRLRILDAARELFAEGGEEGLTLRRVGERIEYSATTIYLHFQNKEALVQELCAVDFAAFSRRLIQADRSNDPLERLRKVAVAYMDFGLQYPGHYRAMFITPNYSVPKRSPSPVDTHGKPSTDTAEKLDPSPYDFLQAAVFKALAAGIFRVEYRDVPSITQTIWSGLHGVVSLHQTKSKHPTVPWRPIQTLTEMMVECLLNGMIVPSLASSPTWR